MASGEDARDKSTQLSTKPLGLELIDAFHDALAEAWIECNQLCAALGRNDYEDAEIAASDAVACWLIAHHVSGQLELDEQRRAEVDHRLWEAHRVLHDLFVSLRKQIESSSLCDTLAQLRTDLVHAKHKRPGVKTRSSG